MVRKSFSDSVGVGRRGVIKKGCLPCSQTPSPTPQTHKSRVTMRTQVNLYGGHVVKGKSYDTVISLSSSMIQYKSSTIPHKLLKCSQEDLPLYRKCSRCSRAKCPTAALSGSSQICVLSPGDTCFAGQSRRATSSPTATWVVRLERTCHRNGFFKVLRIFTTLGGIRRVWELTRK